MKTRIVHSSQDKTSAGVMLRLNSPRRNASCVVRSDANSKNDVCRRYVEAILIKVRVKQEKSRPGDVSQVCLHFEILLLGLGSSSRNCATQFHMKNKTLMSEGRW